MKNLKAAAATDLFNTLFDNPEITAMAAICEILKDLPDDAARLRVMRWSFGRFGGEEFKRPMTDARFDQVTAQPVAAPRVPAAAPRQPETVVHAQAVAPKPPSLTVGEVDAKYGPPDFAREISELKDLFQNPRGIVADSFA